MATAERIIAGAGLVVEPAATLPQPSAAATIVRALPEEAGGWTGPG